MLSDHGSYVPLPIPLRLPSVPFDFMLGLRSDLLMGLPRGVVDLGMKWSRSFPENSKEWPGQRKENKDPNRGNK